MEKYGDYTKKINDINKRKQKTKADLEQTGKRMMSCVVLVILGVFVLVLAAWADNFITFKLLSTLLYAFGLGDFVLGIGLALYYDNLAGKKYIDYNELKKEFDEYVSLIEKTENKQNRTNIQEDKMLKDLIITKTDSNTLKDKSKYNYSFADNDAIVSMDIHNMDNRYIKKRVLDNRTHYRG